MFIDKLAEFADSFDLDQETGTYLLTNQIDLGAAGRDPGNGQPVYLVVTVDEAFTDGGDAATLTLRLVSDDTASIHDTTCTVHLTTAAMLKAALAAGEIFVFAVPIEGSAYERYLGVQAIVGTAGFDAGMISAFLTLDPAGWKAHADAVN